MEDKYFVNKIELKLCNKVIKLRSNNWSHMDYLWFPLYLSVAL